MININFYEMFYCISQSIFSQKKRKLIAHDKTAVDSKPFLRKDQK